MKIQVHEWKSIVFTEEPGWSGKMSETMQAHELLGWEVFSHAPEMSSWSGTTWHYFVLRRPLTYEETAKLRKETLTNHGK